MKSNDYHKWDTAREQRADSARRDDATEAAKRRTAYFRRKYCGGRGPFARIVDDIGLRLIVLIGAYLYFAPRFEKPATAVLLSGIVLGIVTLLLRIVREISLERFIRKEMRRISRTLLCDRLLLTDMQTVAALAGGLCPQEERAVVLQRALPADADALLALIRARRGCGKLHVFACAGFDRSAEAFAARANGLLVLHEQKELLDAAERAGMTPPQNAIDAYIEAELKRERERRKAQRLRASPFLRGPAKRYLVTALILLCVSFFTRYMLYYRMLAGLCMTIAAYRAIGMRRERTLPNALDIG